MGYALFLCAASAGLSLGPVRTPFLLFVFRVVERCRAFAGRKLPGVTRGPFGLSVFRIFSLSGPTARRGVQVFPRVGWSTTSFRQNSRACWLHSWLHSYSSCSAKACCTVGRPDV